MRRLMLPILLFVFLLTGCSPKSSLDGVEYLVNLPVEHVQVRDFKMGYRVFGKGDPLLLVMGFAGTMDIWDTALVRELAKEHTVIIYDNRGIGSSSAGAEEITIKGMADDAAVLIDVLGYDKVHVMGWSMGGLIAQELALNHPQKVNKLILMGAACDSGPVAEIIHELMAMDVKELISHFFPRPWLEKHPDALSRLPHPAASPDSGVVKSQADAMFNWSGSCGRLHELHKDTLIISGQDDDILPTELSLQLVREIRGPGLHDTRTLRIGLCTKILKVWPARSQLFWRSKRICLFSKGCKNGVKKPEYQWWIFRLLIIYFRTVQ